MAREKMPQTMGKREARQWLFAFVADLLTSFDPLADECAADERLEALGGHEKAFVKECKVLEGEVPWVRKKLMSLAGIPDPQETALPEQSEDAPNFEESVQ